LSLDRRVAESGTIVLIGVCPWDDDDHIWPSIYGSRAEVLYVGGTGNFERLAARRGQRVTTAHIGERFETAILNLRASM
jgi:hypothetical protein